VTFGADALTTGDKLYWSCDASGIADGSPVLITIVTEKAESGEELARIEVRLQNDGEKMRVSR
jgi:hypothetical protein